MFRGDFTLRRAAMGCIGFLGGQLLQRLEIVRLALEFAEGLMQRTQTGNLLHIALGAFAVLPEIRRGHALFERG